MSWDWVSIADAPLAIIDGDRGKEYPKQHEFMPDGPCLFLNTGNVTQTGFAFASTMFISDQKDAALRKGKLSRDDIVMTTRGTIGNCAYYHAGVPYDSVRINSGMVIFRTDPDRLAPGFLYQYLRSDVFGGKAQAIRSGAAQPQLPIRDIKTIDLPLPPLPEQLRIASVLSAYDDMIENNRRRIALLEDAARQLYKEWFVRFRFPGHEHVKVVDGVPEGWALKAIEEVCETIGGGTPSTKKPEYWDDGDVLWFTPTDVTRNSCLALLTSEAKISESGLNNSSAKMIPAGAILMTSRASVGFFGINRLAASTNQGFINIVPHDPAFRMYILQNLMWRVEEIRSHAGGATYKEISKGRFRALPILVPPAALAGEYEDQASLIHAQVETLHIANQQVAKARDLLLPKLMNGTLTV